MWVEEDEAGIVHGLAGVVPGREQSAAKTVDGEHVKASIEYDCRHSRQRVQKTLDGGPNASRRWRAPFHGARGCAGAAKQVEQVRSFGVVETQRVGDPVNDPLGDAGGVTAFETDVV